MDEARRPPRRHRARTGGSRRLPGRIAALSLAAVLWAVLGAGAGAVARTGADAGAATLSSRSPSTSSWTVYHGDAAGTGVARSATAFNTTAPAWTSPALDGAIYGEPLIWAGRVYVATENDTVYALSARTGAVIWSAHLGQPVPAGALPCGDIAPTVGITGTPVIDRSRNEIFVVAEERISGAPAHVRVGLSTTTGKPELTQPVDPAGAHPAALLQRTGLTLDAGQVVFGLGGNYGDCAAYRGRLVAVPEAGGTPKDFTVDAATGESQGAIWMGGAAPAVDSHGRLWVSVGNGSVHSSAHAFDDSDSALELSSSLRLLQFFAPSNWASNNSTDLDMSMAPVLLPGKSRIVYLLDGAHLGGIGGQQAVLGQACGQDIDGGAAVVGMTVYLPCLSGVVAVQAARAPAGLRLLWRAGTGGGPPIMAGGLVWTIGQDGMLYGLDPATGQVRQQAPIGGPANHFPTPSAGDGLLLAASARDVIAFAAVGAGAPATAQPGTRRTASPAGGTSPASQPTSQPTSQPGASHGGGGRPAGVIAGLVAGALVLVSGAALVIRRRRGSGIQ